jgi:hypothetical protein
MFKIENMKELPSDINEKMEDEINESDEEKNDSDKEEEDEEELKTGCPKILLTAVGIGYHNLAKPLI